MLFWVCILVSLWPLLWLLRVLFAAKLLLGLEFRAEQVVAIVAHELPPHLREAAQPWVAQLEPLGFRVLGGWQVQRSKDGALDDFGVVLTHSAEPVRAVIRPHDSADRAGQCWVALRTTTADGFEIVTAAFAPEQLIPRPPGIQVEVLVTDNVAELVQRHRARIAAVPAPAWQCVDIQGAALREQFLCDGVFAHLCASGLVVERAEGVFSFRAVPAFTRAASVLREGARQKKAQQRAQKQSQAQPPVALSPGAQAEFDWQQYRQIGAVMRGRMTGRVKAVITVISFLLFAGVLAWRMSPVVAVSLLVALVIHEYGHLLGMRWFGYRDTQLLFIPFFGGAAVAHDDKVLHPWQHIVIILLGPMPGLFAGLAMLAWGSGPEAPAWLPQAALTAVIMNTFNLLPILPLDGGQIVDVAIGARFPRARVLFLGVSALALVAVASLLEGVGLLLGLAVVMLIRLPIEWKLAAVRREVQREFPEGGDEQTVVRRLLVGLRAPRWKNVAMVQRLQLARALQNVLRMPRPGVGTMAFAVVGYTAPLWAGVPLAVWAVFRRGEAQVAKAEASARSAGLFDARPMRAAASVSDEDNAALPYAQAESLMRAAFKNQAADGDSDQLIDLLRRAAQKKTFVPAAPEPAKPERRWLGGLGNTLVLGQLTKAADERLRFREPVAAAEFALDALRLVRLLDEGERDWSWREHQQVTDEAWRIIEGVFGAGTPLPVELLARMRTLIDEQHEVAFAAAAIPRDALRELRVLAEAARESDGHGFKHGLWVAAAELYARGAGYRAEFINNAVTTHRHLQEVVKGRWPVASEEAAGEDGQNFQVRQVANLVARLRQARAAIAFAERKQGGAAGVRLEALGLEHAWLQHPATRQPLRLERRGSLEVLAFAPHGAKALNESDDHHLVWRLPP